MLKLFAVLFNLLSFIIISAILPADIKIDARLPEGSEFVKDSTYIIEITIAKGEIFGFAKFQQNLPPGFDAQPVETADASFTYADGKVKFIWMALPEIPEIKVSYALTATATAPATGVIEGKFSYIEDNERKSYDMPNIPITVITVEPEVAEVVATASVSRAVEDLGNNEYKVRLTIEKQGISGFAKLEEYLPEGSEAVALESKQAVFSQVDEKAKFVWMSVPADETMEIMYRVKSTQPMVRELATMEGNFSYLEGNETKTVPVAIAMVEEPVAVVEEEPVVETPVQEPEPQPQVEEEVAREEEQPAEPVTGQVEIPAPETGVSYKVQVVAGHKLVTEAFLRETYKFQEPYNVENHEGWIKYTTGNFDMYKGARDKREALNEAGHAFPGPFVTAYNAGERITVQEALMITNQQWFK